MAVEHFTPDIDGDENLVQIAALTPTDNAVIIGNGTAWTAESGGTLRTSLGLAIGSDVMAYDADLADWAAVTRASGFDTFAGTPTSANLRALLSDESGSGALLFAGGALGTPASGTLTNCTGLPNASVVGLGTAALVADSGLVHISGTETVTGTKTFTATQTKIAPTVGSGADPADAAFVVQAPGAGNSGPYIVLQSNSATPTAGDVFGFRYFGKDSAANDQVYGSINCAIMDPTSTSEDSELRFATIVAGTFANRFVLGASAAFSVPITVSGDTVMTRGAAETVTGVKTFTASPVVKGSQGAYRFHRNSDNALAYLIGRSSSTDDAQNFFLYDQIGAGFCFQFSSSRLLQMPAYGAGTLVTDSSGNVTPSSDEELKYITGNFKRGLADLRAMDGPVQYQWKNEQLELAENADTLSDTRAKLIEAKAAHVDADDEKRDDALAKVSMIEGELKQKTYLDSLTREQTTYTGWTAQGVRKGIPEAVKAGPDGVLNFDDRPILAAMYNALLDMAARVEALEAAQ